MNIQELIVLLNGDLEREYAAAIQYIQHASCLNDVFYTFQSELLTHADEEIGHAKKISDYINYLGGRPSTEVHDRFSSSDSVAMLTQDLSGEMEAIVRYKERAGQAQMLGEHGLYNIICDILEDEESHENDLKSILNR